MQYQVLLVSNEERKGVSPDVESLKQPQTFTIILDLLPHFGKQDCFN
jgi:hypothetical protein